VNAMAWQQCVLAVVRESVSLLIQNYSGQTSA
jgi:hypothetical protein